jgi:hypothetical protein
MKWIPYVANIEESRTEYKILSGNLRNTGHLEYLSTQERILLKQNLRK